MTWLSFSEQWFSSEALNKDIIGENTRGILKFYGNLSLYFFKGVIEKDKVI